MLLDNKGLRSGLKAQQAHSPGHRPGWHEATKCALEGQKRKETTEESTFFHTIGCARHSPSKLELCRAQPALCKGKLGIRGDGALGGRGFQPARYQDNRMYLSGQKHALYILGGPLPALPAVSASSRQLSSQSEATVHREGMVNTRYTPPIIRFLKAEKIVQPFSQPFVITVFQ